MNLSAKQLEAIGYLGRHIKKLEQENASLKLKLKAKKSDAADRAIEELRCDLRRVIHELSRLMTEIQMQREMLKVQQNQPLAIRLAEDERLLHHK